MLNCTVVLASVYTGQWETESGKNIISALVTADAPKPSLLCRVGFAMLPADILLSGIAVKARSILWPNPAQSGPALQQQDAVICLLQHLVLHGCHSLDLLSNIITLS